MRMNDRRDAGLQNWQRLANAGDTPVVEKELFPRDSSRAWPGAGRNDQKKQHGRGSRPEVRRQDCTTTTNAEIAPTTVISAIRQTPRHPAIGA